MIFGCRTSFDSTFLTVASNSGKLNGSFSYSLRLASERRASTCSLFWLIPCFKNSRALYEAKAFLCRERLASSAFSVLKSWLRSTCGYFFSNSFTLALSFSSSKSDLAFGTLLSVWLEPAITFLAKSLNSLSFLRLGSWSSIWLSNSLNSCLALRS